MTSSSSEVDAPISGDASLSTPADGPEGPGPVATAPAEAAPTEVAPTEAKPTEPVKKAAPSLKRRAMLGSLWTMGGFGFNQAMRFGSNIVLAWLLAPQIFGLMALVNTFMTALEMFSDVGIAPSIIHNKRGDDPRYLNTAWTIQVVRGFLLWAASAVIALPVSLIWDPQLLAILPVAGAAAAISGFQSTSVATLNRQLKIGPIMVMRVIQAIGGIAVMITWALVEREVYGEATVWALVAGNIAAAVSKVVTSHCLSGGTHSRFGWDPTAAREMFRFGRWIFLSTVITFLAAQSDKLLFEPLVGVKLLGLYYMAQIMATLVPHLSRQVAALVGFPALADLYRRDVPRFKSRLRHLRLVLLGFTETGLICVVLIGPWFIQLVYPQEYQAGNGTLGMDWMLLPLAVGAMAGMVNSTYGTAFMAMGRTFFVMGSVALQLCLVLACALTGFYYGGPTGFVFGMAFVQWLLYPFVAIMTMRAGIWDPIVDFPILALTGIVGFTLILYG